MAIATRRPAKQRGTGLPARHRRSPQHLAKRFGLYATLTLGAFIVLLPVIWMIFTSVKPEGAIVAHPSQLFPTRFTWTNYRDVLRAIPFARQFGNTIVFAGTVTVVSLLFDSMTAYALARLDFPGKRLLFVLVLLFLMMPIQITLIPVYQLVAKLGLVNTFPGLVIPRATNAFGIFFLRQFFLSIPKELEDAARVDGASDFRIYRSVILRLSVPALLTLGLFHFMYNWNDLLWPLIVSSNSSMYTLSSGLALFLGQHVIQYGLIMAGSVLAIVPMVIAFLIIQRRFTESIATSGLR